MQLFYSLSVFPLLRENFTTWRAAYLVEKSLDLDKLLNIKWKNTSNNSNPHKHIAKSIGLIVKLPDYSFSSPPVSHSVS